MKPVSYRPVPRPSAPQRFAASRVRRELLAARFRLPPGTRNEDSFASRQKDAYAHSEKAGWSNQPISSGLAWDRSVARELFLSEEALPHQEQTRFRAARFFSWLLFPRRPESGNYPRAWRGRVGTV